MLVLHHRPGEDVVMTLPNGDEIIITFVGRHGYSQQVRIGYTAPQNVVIDRRKVHERKKLGLPAPAKLVHA